MRVNLGDKKTRCSDCGLWSPVGKSCMWCGSKLTAQPMIKLRCTTCQKITYVTRYSLYDKNRCSWCNADISVVQ